ncbi:MAG: ATP-binding protein, partial [Nanoarchaeota archaeon]
MPNNEEYNAESIKVLEGLDAVRKRPSMYIGSTGKDGLHHLVFEVVDNSIDECLAGYCKIVQVILNKDGSCTVIDDGRGIPVEKHSVYKKSAMEIALTKLHAGGKFEKQAYQISGGLHGVGVSCVNALSIKLIAKVCRDGKIYQQEYKVGKPLYDVKAVGNCDKDKTGTEITFYPDKEIFSTVEFDFSTLKKRLQEIAFLNPEITIILKDEKQDKEEKFHYEGGILEFVNHINKSKGVLHKPIYFKRESNGNTIEIAIQYNEGYNENIFGFVNTINTTEGGTHISGFKTALTRAINDYAEKKGLLKNEKIVGDDTREGLTAIVNLKMRDPQFEGQTKTKLGNSDMKGIVDSIVYTALIEVLEENPNIAGKVAQKALESAKARNAAKKARDLVRRKSAFGGIGLPGKLSDCSSRQREKTELYIVEGDSAAGCFSGETKVALADGRNLSFIDLVEEDNVGKENFCYTIKLDGSIGITKIKSPRITKKDTEVIEITLDNNEKIICTPNHKFMLRDGNYKEAKDLLITDSLMPLYLEVTIKNNHKIKSIIKLNQKIDVYDFEVPETHNFALASGVFVHNSAKSAREKEFQAILPLKGKILNVEKAAPSKTLSSEEIINLITAIGTGVKEEFDIEKLRYHKVIIMSVDGEEATFIQSPNGKISFVKIGNFIDSVIEGKVDLTKYKVLCFGLKSGKTQFKSIKAVIRHPIQEKLYEIQTSYGRNTKITSSHSVFVFENNNFKLKKGNEIKKGDRIVAPKNLPLFNYNPISKLDVLSLFINSKVNIKDKIYIRGKSIEELMKSKVRKMYKDDNEFVDERVIVPEFFGRILSEKRNNKKLSQKFLCENLGVKQPCVYYDWEKGKNKPSLTNFKKYLKVLEIDEKNGLSQVQIVNSKLDNIWDKQYKNSGRNKVKDYVEFSKLQKQDLEFIGNEVRISPFHYASKGINRFVNVDSNLAKLMGFWVAEGSCSLRNGIRVSIGNNNE